MGHFILDNPATYIPEGWWEGSRMRNDSIHNEFARMAWAPEVEIERQRLVRQQDVAASKIIRAEMLPRYVDDIYGMKFAVARTELVNAANYLGMVVDHVSRQVESGLRDILREQGLLR